MYITPINQRITKNNTVFCGKSNQFKHLSEKLNINNEKFQKRINELKTEIYSTEKRENIPEEAHEVWNFIKGVVNQLDLYLSEKSSEKYFLDSKTYGEELSKYIYRLPHLMQFSQQVHQSMYNLELDKVYELLQRGNNDARQIVLKDPKFILDLADFPVNEKNEKTFQNILEIVEKFPETPLNIIDDNGITLLEKVINAENSMFLKTIKNILKQAPDKKGYLVYEPMQKFAFDRIQNQEFKNECKDLPIVFFDVFKSIRKEKLFDLDEKLEQLNCGFCNMEFAFKNSIIAPLEDKEDTYGLSVKSIVRKHFPKETDRYMNKVVYR